MTFKHPPFLIALALLVLTSGCTITGKSSPTYFHILPNPPAAEETTSRRMTIGIADIELPHYLERPQIVTLREGTAVNLAEFHRWAEPLGAGFQRVLTAGLISRMPNSRIVPLPARRVKVDWTVEIQVRDFQVRKDRCLLLSDWRLQSDRTTQTWQRSTIEESISEGGYPGIVSAMGRAVDRLAGQIAAELAALENQ
ncbi:PqiC family protein [Methylohalobius crimeensis]|uniref:PqiC family protein n=1 Tax=Methylohalobius crimeensis TaxID=244365 RepID=UPI0003B57F1C|nr:PqiC family protein [Methylohalobius crimeensis]